MMEINNLDNRISFREFLGFILPMRHSAVRECYKRIEIGMHAKRLSEETVYAFALLLEKEILFANKLSNQRAILRTRKIKTKQLMAILKAPNLKEPRARKLFSTADLSSLTYI
jgi:hypothetical protein